VLRGAKSVDAVWTRMRARRTYGGVRSSTSKRWMSAVRRTSSRGDPKRVKGDMAVLVNVCFACDQHHATKLCTVRSHRLQCLPSPSLWSADGVGSTCVPPCGCMRGSQQCDIEHAALRSQRQGPAALAFGVVYGHGAMPKPRGGAAGGSGRHISKGRTPCPTPCVSSACSLRFGSAKRGYICHAVNKDSLCPRRT
jgi:hypothetical protein